MVVFNEGDTVKFIGNSDYIPIYVSLPSVICQDHIIHGSTVLHQDYYTEFATIVKNYGNYLIVRYKDNNGKYVQLGFAPDKLELIKKAFTSWKDRYTK